MTNISPQQAIRNAVEAELAAARFYRLLAESTDDLEAQSYFSDLSEQEVKHAAAIQEAGAQIADGPLPAHAVGDVEIIETLPAWRYADNLTLADALEIAFAAENQAALYYDTFADYLAEPAASFFRNLAKAEEQHAAEVARRKAALANRP